LPILSEDCKFARLCASDEPTEPNNVSSAYGLSQSVELLFSAVLEVV